MTSGKSEKESEAQGEFQSRAIRWRCNFCVHFFFSPPFSRNRRRDISSNAALNKYRLFDVGVSVVIANMFSRGVLERAVLRLTFASVLSALVGSVLSYEPPEPNFEVLVPRGLRVSIPHVSGMRIFGFHANLNKGIRLNEYGEIAGDAYSAKNGRWTFEDSDVTLRDADVLHYWIYVQENGANHKRDVRTWTYSSAAAATTAANQIENVEENNSADGIPSAGKLLLEENFDSFNASLWKREIKMPLAPDYEFCVYHNENHQQLVRVKDGQLFIRPIILEDSYGENATAYGMLQLNGCTSMFPYECSRRALSFSILPPVISARLTTKERFTLRYGKFEIRAKFPEGDWLYPEMWLEPKYSTYGANYASGRVLLGLTRGNENLVNSTDVSKIYDTRRLDFGVRVGAFPYLRESLVTKVDEFGERWTQNFHVYTTVWTSDGFTFSVDDDVVGRIDSDDGWMSGGPNAGRKGAPFDQQFYITLGVGVGGVRVFPDETISFGMPKPWRNLGAKAMLNFWNARDQWLPSWRRESGAKTAFVIDYIKVWAL